MNTNARNSPPLFSAADSVSPGGNSPDKPVDVLVVDDEVAIRQVICAMLVSLGHRAYTAQDGVEAMRLISAADSPKYDILLTDFRMPGLLGDELARRFREAFPKAGIIVMSGESPQIPALPRCEFLSKPFHAGALEARVRAVLHNGSGEAGG